MRSQREGTLGEEVCDRPVAANAMIHRSNNYQEEAEEYSQSWGS